jgi:hypothetical protein
MAGARASSGAVRLAALVLAVAAIACGCGSRGATAAVERHYASKPADAALVSHEIIEVDQWAEHGAVARVRERYADGRVEEVRLEVVGRGGVWKVEDPGRDR